MTPSRPLLPRGPLRIALFIGLLALTNLACFTINQTIVYNQDGSGAGVVLLEMTTPRDRPGQSVSFSDSQEITASLAEQGWEEITVTTVDEAHYLYNAKYTFGVEEGSKQLSDVVPGFTLKAEEAENGYKYFTFEGTADFTEMESFWNTVEKDWAVNGFEIELGDLGFGASESKVEMTAEEVQSMIDTYGPPAQLLNVILPGQTPVEANQFWDNEDDFGAGKTDTLSFTWEPGKRASAPLKAVRRLEPLTTVSAAEAQSQIDKLLTIYEATIPHGKGPLFQWWAGPLGGKINNNFSAYFNGDQFICSDYQVRVMNWLDSIRTSPNDSLHNLLKGLDYGPVETNGGGHRAVVLFPRGTDWRSSGIVLDPWPYQEPRAWSVGNWSIALWGLSEAAKNPQPDANSGELYPHLTGKTSSYPASVEQQGDLAKGLAKPTKILFVRSPVTVLVTFTDGRRIGTLPDGTIVNDFGAAANLYTLPKNDSGSEFEWYMFLPDGDFSVELSGTGAGDFHVLLATSEGYSGFGPQPIQQGQTATFSADTLGQASPLTLPDGSNVQPLSLAPDQVDAAMGIPLEETTPATQAPDVIGQDNPPDATSPTTINLPGGVDSQMLIVGSLICLGLIGLLAIGASAVIGAGWFINQRKQQPAPQPVVVAARPPEQVKARLLVEGPDGNNELLLLNTSLSLGRTAENGLMLPSSSVSRQHAVIDFENGRYVVRDLGSANGVLVNGRKIDKPVELSSGDVIQIEPFTIKFRVG